jgi:hypothetical protein
VKKRKMLTGSVLIPLRDAGHLDASVVHSGIILIIHITITGTHE